MPDRSAAWTLNEEPHQLIGREKIAIVMLTEEDEGGAKRDDSHAVKGYRARVLVAHTLRKTWQ